MSRPEELRLRDVLAAIETIRAHIAGGEFDRKTSDAVLYNLVVIGEAAARIGDETRERAAEIPWTRIVGLRNLVTHEYFRVELDDDSGHRGQLARPARHDGPATPRRVLGHRNPSRVRFPPPPPHATRLERQDARPGESCRRTVRTQMRKTAPRSRTNNERRRGEHVGEATA